MNATASGAYRYYVLAILMLVGVCGWVDRQVFAILMESIRREFALSDTQLGLLGGIAFGLFHATLGVPVAWLADRFSRRTIIAVSVALWSAMTALCGLASGFSTLFLGRMGVGIGEAGSSPPAQSLVSAYFRPSERGFAMGVLFLYLPLGFMLGFLLGGWIDQFLGWREAFVIVGLPGVLLAAVVRFTIREPARSGPGAPGVAGETFRETFAHLWRKRALRHVVTGGALHGIGAWAVAVWVPSFFMRAHGMGSGEVGSWLAAAFGVAGSVGMVTGGRLADRLARRSGDARWYVRLAAGCVAASVPLSAAVYVVPAPVGAMACLAGSLFVGQAFFGPVMSTVQGLAGPHRRAQAAAYYLLVANLVSMGLGPLIVGASSDAFGDRYGPGALGVALQVLYVVTGLWASLHLLRAASTLRAELEDG